MYLILPSLVKSFFVKQNSKLSENVPYLCQPGSVPKSLGPRLENVSLQKNSDSVAKKITIFFFFWEHTLSSPAWFSSHMFGIHRTAWQKRKTKQKQFLNFVFLCFCAYLYFHYVYTKDKHRKSKNTYIVFVISAVYILTTWILRQNSVDHNKTAYIENLSHKAKKFGTYVEQFSIAPHNKFAPHNQQFCHVWSRIVCQVKQFCFTWRSKMVMVMVHEIPNRTILSRSL